MILQDKLLMGAGLGIGLVLLIGLNRSSGGSLAAGVGETVGKGAVDLADGVLSGTVQGIGGVVGIQPTNLTKCQQDIAAGRTWDASFSCPAGTWLKYLVSNNNGGATGAW